MSDNLILLYMGCTEYITTAILQNTQLWSRLRNKERTKGGQRDFEDFRTLPTNLADYWVWRSYFYATILKAYNYDIRKST